MSFSWISTPAGLLGTFVTSSLLASSIAGSVQAQDTPAAPIVHVAEHCTDYGLGFIDLGRGTCGRMHVRVANGAQNANADVWSSHTSSAALRSDGPGVLSGAGDLSHLRVRNGLESYSPFR